MEDNYGRTISYLRLSVTELCNLRCRYCMGEDGILKKDYGDILTEDEMVNAVAAATGLGIKKLRITGGEPLVKKNIMSVCQRTSHVPGIEKTAITTNGILLADMAGELKAAGIKSVNISLDTLDRGRFEYLTRRKGLDRVLRGIEAAVLAGFENVKINTVIIGGFNDDEITGLADLSIQMPVDIRFIELMPMYHGGDFSSDAYISGKAVFQKLPGLIAEKKDGKEQPEDSWSSVNGIHSVNEKLSHKEDNYDGVAQMYRFPGAPGRVGFITPLSRPFCSRCNRIRITADGYVKPCLHSRDEYCIKGLESAEMAKVIKKAINAKPMEHSKLSYDIRSKAGRNMNQIGG